MVQLLESDIKTTEVLDWQGVHLLHFAASSCSQKTRIFLNLKGIDWHSHPLNLVSQDNYKPWFLGINPRGLVPVLVHDGAVHIESNDILDYLERTFPSPPLIPVDQRDVILAGLQAEDDLHMDIRTLTMRFVLPRFLAQKKPATLADYEQSDGTIEGAADPHKQVELNFWREFGAHGISDAKARVSARRFRDALAVFETRLSRQPYLAGADLTVLDIAWFIYTHRLLAATYPVAEQHPRVYQWYSSLLARDAFAREVRSPAPLRMISGALHLAQRATGKTLSKVGEF